MVYRRTILEVHETKDSFVFKRIMEMAIYADLLLILLNLEFWTIFVFDATMAKQARKLEILFYTCIAPFLIAKLFFRFWPWAKL